MDDLVPVLAPTNEQRLENIEQYLAQLVATDKPYDAIKPFTIPFGPSPAIVTTSNKFDYINGTQKVSFDIPEETPYIYIPETPRGLALYRDNEPFPFALNERNTAHSFVLPHLTRLTVEVFPGLETGSVTFYASSRPLELGERKNSGRFRAVFPYGNYVYNNVTLNSPLIMLADRDARLVLYAKGDSFSGVTNIIVRALGIDDSYNGNAGDTIANSSGEVMSGVTFVSGALGNGVYQYTIAPASNFPAILPRYFYINMYLTATTAGVDNANLKVSYALV